MVRMVQKRKCINDTHSNRKTVSAALQKPAGNTLTIKENLHSYQSNDSGRCRNIVVLI